MGGLRRFQSVSIIITLLIMLWTSACVSSPTAVPTTVVQSYIFSAYVESSTTDNDIPNAHVIIHVANKAPLEGFTDVNGYVRIPFAISYAGKAARLFIEVQGYEKHRQEINLSKEMLPDIIRLDPLLSAGEPQNEATEEPTAKIIEGNTPKISSSEEPTQEASFELPTPTDTSQPIDTPSPTSTSTDMPIPPTDTPIPEPESPQESTPDVTGRLAIPLVLGTTPKVYIAGITGEFLGDIDTARQPDFKLDGSQLIVNGDGGGLDKLRMSSPDGKQWQEIGDLSLGGHSHPAWSPDGTQLIYDDGTIDPAGWHIFMCGCGSRQGEGDRLDAAGNRPVIDPNPLYPLWTTNDRFVFRGCNTWSGGGNCGLWMTQGNLGQPEQLTHNPNHIPTDIYENMVVYTSAEGGNRNIYVLNIETGDGKQLTFHPASDGLATISPDGQTVAFLSDRDGMLAIWHVSIKGGPIEKMFDIPLDWGTLRADGWSEERLSWGKDG